MMGLAKFFKNENRFALRKRKTEIRSCCYKCATRRSVMYKKICRICLRIKCLEGSFPGFKKRSW